jgi:hypothetical protein
LEIYDEKAVTAEDYRYKVGLWVTRQLKKLNDKKVEEQPKNNPVLIAYMQKLLQFLSTEVESCSSL